MGAQASTQKSSITQDLITTAYNKCPDVTVNNKMKFGNIRVRQPAYCESNANINLEQNAALDANCLVDNLQNNLIDAYLKSDTATKGGFGLGVTTDISELKTNIQNKIETSCGNLSTSNEMHNQDIDYIGCGDVRVVQNASAKTACTINTLQDTIKQVDKTSNVTTEGTTLGGLLFGYNTGTVIGMVFLGLFVVIIVIILGVILIRMGSGSSDEDDDGMMDEMDEMDESDDDQYGGSKVNRKLLMGIILLFLILVVIFSHFGKNKENFSFFEETVKKINEVNKIANIDSKKFVFITGIINDNSLNKESNILLEDYYKHPLEN